MSQSISLKFKLRRRFIDIDSETSDDIVSCSCREYDEKEARETYYSAFEICNES